MPGIWGDGQRGGIFGAKIPVITLTAAERDRYMQQRAEAERQQAQARIAGAFDASQGMQEPSQALYAAKHQRAMDVLGNRPPEGPGFRDAIASLASLGPRAWGGAQKMWQAAPMAAEALYNDPMGSINSVGLAGQAATDAIVQGMVKPFMQFGDPNVDPVENAADIALTAMGGSAAIPAEENALRMGIKAYHGSPHSFERFDASKIGTGEGAQAYGHGLYFAEREGVAKDYRDKLAPSNLDDVSPDAVAQAKFGPEWQKLVDELRPARERRDRLYHTGEYQLDSGADEFQQLDKRIGEGDAQLDALHKQMVDDTVARNPHLLKGRMYEVDIAADPEHFLDWDKPLSEQSPQVREAMAKAGYSSPQVSLPPQHSTVGATAGRELQKPEETALLREHGIPGIRYLDQGSRTKGTVVAGDGKPTGYHNIDSMIANTYGTWEKFKAANPNPSGQLKAAIDELDARGGVKFNRDEGTRNYVVFPGNEHLISILKKYGLPISAAGLAALSQLHPQEAQAAQRKKGK